jgi:hypothetical protein
MANGTALVPWWHPAALALERELARHCPHRAPRSPSADYVTARMPFILASASPETELRYS